MPADPLREKLKALVEKWRVMARVRWSQRRPARAMDRLVRGRAEACRELADQLAALLAESEPESRLHGFDCVRVPRPSPGERVARFAPREDPDTGEIIYELVRRP